MSFKYHSQLPAVIRILDVINKLAAATLLINAVDYTFTIGNRVRTVFLANHNAALTRLSFLLLRCKVPMLSSAA